MSYLFSRALAEAYSEENSLDGLRFAPLNVMLTRHPFWHRDKTTDFLSHSLFGPMSAPLTENLGEELLTWFLAGFRAKTSVQPEREQESQENAQDSGLNSLASLAKYDHDTCSWKTPQFSLLGDSELYSETWPRWGLMRNGECWEQPTLVRRIGGTGSGLWPTPRANDGEKRGNFDLENPRNGLAAAAKWPTPTSQTTMEKNSRPLSEQIGGQLNADWVELLMGWPKGWTAMGPLESAELCYWGDDWEDGTTRVAQGVKDRVDRLRCIGNGQVPQCAAEAWRLLK